MSHYSPVKTTPTTLLPAWMIKTAVTITVTWFVIGIVTMGSGWRAIPFIALTGLTTIAWAIYGGARLTEIAERRRTTTEEEQFRNMVKHFRNGQQ